MPVELRTWPSLRALGEAKYRELWNEAESPFLCFEWLDALERTGCVAPETGWLPMHVTLHESSGPPEGRPPQTMGDRLLAFTPLYVKGNSEGEFVFDHGWARFAEGSLGIAYYPKLVAAVPFTPATGTRLLVRPGADRAVLAPLLADGLRQLADKLGASSAHVLFPMESEAEALAAAGLCPRLGVQFQWHSAGEASFDDFLGRFTAKRRHQIRRERREAVADGLEVEVLTGSDLSPELADFVHDFYASTVDQHFWGRRYLNRAFFEEVLGSMKERLHVVAARDRSSGRRIAGTFNVLGSRALYGRYWGALEDRKFLHFELCFYRGIEDAIARGLARFEPGAGGEHKLARGFEPTPTHSAHYLADPRLERAVREFASGEERALRREIAAAREQMHYRDRG